MKKIINKAKNVLKINKKLFVFLSGTERPTPHPATQRLHRRGFPFLPADGRGGYPLGKRRLRLERGIQPALWNGTKPHRHPLWNGDYRRRENDGVGDLFLLWSQTSWGNGWTNLRLVIISIFLFNLIKNRERDFILYKTPLLLEIEFVTLTCLPIIDIIISPFL